MPNSIFNAPYKNLANIVSLLGILPLVILFGENGYAYIIPLMIYNNFMDDLDGVLAAKLNIRSQFGANLDNVCDAIAHTAIVMLVGMHFGGLTAAACVLAAAVIVIRGVSRLDPTANKSCGSPTNELIRHMFFVLLLADLFAFEAGPFLITACVFHAVSMLVPYKLPWLLRGLTKSATSVGLINVALVTAWLVPWMTPIIAAAFIGSYLCSLTVASVGRLRAMPHPVAHQANFLRPGRCLPGDPNSHEVLETQSQSLRSSQGR